jgi:uncharacterized membrane protein YecN with MAPEG domain
MKSATAFEKGLKVFMIGLVSVIGGLVLMAIANGMPESILRLSGMIIGYAIMFLGTLGNLFYQYRELFKREKKSGS